MGKPLPPEEMDPEDVADLLLEAEGERRRRCPGTCRWPGYPRHAPTYGRNVVARPLGTFLLHICSVCHGLRAWAATGRA